MYKQITLQDLDAAFAREYVSSQDPDISLRYVIPVPNWLKNGLPSVQHASIKEVEKNSSKQWKFVFTNYKDNAEQGVKIDGSSAVVLMGVTRAVADEITAIVHEHVDNIQDLTPDALFKILEKSYTVLGVNDRFNKDLESLHKYFHPYNVKNDLGGFLPQLNHSSAIYVSGEGEFLDGPTLTPQKFQNGAFINFPGQRLTDAFKKEILQGGRLVQADTFIADRTSPDGSPVSLEKIPQQEFKF